MLCGSVCYSTPKVSRQVTYNRHKSTFCTALCATHHHSLTTTTISQQVPLYSYSATQHQSLVVNRGLCVAYSCLLVPTRAYSYLGTVEHPVELLVSNRRNCHQLGRVEANTARNLRDASEWVSE